MRVASTCAGGQTVCANRYPHKYNDEDDISTVKKVMVKEDLNWRTFVDRGLIADKWKPIGTPAFYIIDAKGVIRNKWAGPPAPKVLDTAWRN